MQHRIFGAPSRYVQGPGALRRLAVEISGLASHPVAVVDAALLPRIESQLPPSMPVLPFAGEVTHAAIEALALACGEVEADLLVAVGGGKSLDAGKGVAHRRGLRYVTVPTIASNDSPTGRAVAIYDDAHVLVSIETVARSPELVLVDTALIAAAPPHYLRAGIGDAIAKKFEAERAVRDGAANFFDGRACRTALAIADGCYRVLREAGVAAMAAASRGVADAALEDVVEANILMAGLAWENAGVSFAHAVVRGLVRLPGVRDRLHGEHVAYGTLVHCAIERRSLEEIRDLRGFLRAVGLACSLAELGATAPDTGMFTMIASAMLEGPRGGRIQVSADAAAIVAALRQIEYFEETER